jgi:NAD(P)-dependent dehydrogenase (short-subunit alcohol dehydrogenase family)
MKHSFWFVLLAIVSLSAQAAEPQKAVLVTGASTGIGRYVTERLARDGYFVYGGARKPADIAALSAIKNVQGISLDVTDPAQIAAAVATITTAGRGLYGLVNNAGVAVSGALASTTDEDFDFVMKINVYGPYRVTKAFAPLIIAAKGRITTIGSISGILSGRDLGVYSMSKHAIEAFGDSLAAEMAPLGVAVSIVEPGNYNSQISASAVRRAGREGRLGNRDRFKQPDEVAEAVSLALFEPTPKRRYMVVPNQQEAEITIRQAITELTQLNEGQAYTYDREALLKMLDEALAKAKPRSSPASN